MMVDLVKVKCCLCDQYGRKFYLINLCQTLMSALMTMVVVMILVSTLMEVTLVNAVMDCDYYLIRSLAEVSQQKNCMFLTYSCLVYFVYHEP